MSYDDSKWPRASAWLSTKIDPTAPLGVVGVPFNRSLTPGRYDQGPVAIRTALERFSTYDFATNRDLTELKVVDYRNIVADTHKLGETVEQLKPVFHHPFVCLLGGDSGVTRVGPAALALARNTSLAKIGVVSLDAHLHLRDLTGGPMNSNPIRGLIQDGLPGQNIFQIGIQSFANSQSYANDAHDFGIRNTLIEDCSGGKFAEAVLRAIDELAPRVDAVYVDINLDVVDIAHVPGCPGARPGGINPGQLRHAVRLCGRHPAVAAIDIVELDPSKDVNHITAMLGGVCLLEFAVGVLNRA